MASTRSIAADSSGWTLVLHGGVGVTEQSQLATEQRREIREALHRALSAGSAILANGGKALDAIEATVRALEDDPHFNAGRGAVLADDGTIRLDAAIMDGATRATGAVAGVMYTRNPVSLARAVMEHTPYVFLAAPGADQFSREHGLEQVEQAWFETPARRLQLQRIKKQTLSGAALERSRYGTVGAVARDRQGHLAAATSTGGMAGKRWGRIGDSPIIGASTYADDRHCAVSSTGAGEVFIRVGVAKEICALIQHRGEHADRAAEQVLREVVALGGEGGVIVVTPRGEGVWRFSTEGMYRARAAEGSEPVVAIYDEAGGRLADGAQAPEAAGRKPSSAHGVSKP